MTWDSEISPFDLGAARDANTAFETLLVGREDQYEEIRQIYRANAAGIGNPRTRIEKYEVELIPPFIAPSFQDRPAALLADEFRPRKITYAIRIIERCRSAGNHRQAVISVRGCVLRSNVDFLHVAF